MTPNMLSRSLQLMWTICLESMGWPLAKGLLHHRPDRSAARSELVGLQKHSFATEQGPGQPKAWHNEQDTTVAAPPLSGQAMHCEWYH